MFPVRSTALRAVKELNWVKNRPSVSDIGSRISKESRSDGPSPSTFLPLLQQLPDVEHAVGYGSGVFPQKDHTKKVMVDLILVTNDPRKWHEEVSSEQSESL
jgi:hypothetical protein